MHATPLVRTLTLTLFLSAIPALAEWHFAIPPGWDDLSPGKPIPQGIPEQVSTLTQSGQFHTYGMDFKGRSPQFAANFNAIVRPIALVANEQVLNEIKPMIYTEVAQEAPGARAAVLESTVVTIGGQPALRFVVDVKTSSLTLRLLKYALPGGDETAFLSYAATPETFPKYLPVFEAAVQQTQGIAAPPLGRRIGARLRAWGGDGFSAEDWQKIVSGVGRLVGILVALALFNYFRRRQKKGAPQA